MAKFALSQAAEHDPRIDIPRPVFDPPLAPTLDALGLPEELDLNGLRAISIPAKGNPFVFTAEAILKGRPHLKHIEHSIVGPEGNTVILSVFSPREPTSVSLPALYYVHGGGQVAGDRCDSVSDKQFQYGTAWCGVTNIQAWKYVLGEDFGSDKVTPYQSPARGTDLSNLPQTYIDAGECEVFRDPAVLYAMKMWECGSTCELHVWPGGFHGFDAIGDKNLPLVKAANGAKAAWIRRILESKDSMTVE